MFLAVMLRQDVGPRSKVWVGAAGRAKAGMQAALGKLLAEEKNRVMRKHLNEATGRLASHTVKKGEWTQFQSIFERLCSSKEAQHVQSGLFMSGILAEYAPSAVQRSMKPIFNLIQKSLSPSNRPELQVAAIKAAVSFIIGFEGNVQQGFIRLIPDFFKVAVKLAGEANDEPLQDAIDEIANLIGFRVAMFRPYTSDIIKLMTKTAKHGELEAGTRRMALSLIVELAKKDRTSVKQVKETMTEVVPLAISFLTRVDDDIRQWAQDEDGGEKDPDDEDFCMGWDTLECLATWLGGASVLSAAWPMIQKGLASSKWQEKHAAVSAICALTPGCVKAIQPKLPGLLGMIAPLTVAEKEHVRVRWMAVNAIGTFCVFFAEDIQSEKLAAPVGKCLVTALDSRAHVRISAHAALSLVDYCKVFEDGERLAPFAEAMLMSLRKLLGVNARGAQTSALSAVSAVASRIEEKFQAYYKAFMPGVTSILMKAKGRDNMKLRAKAIECVGVIAAAVGRETFAPQFKSIMEFLLKTQGHGLTADDPQQNAILMCCARICQCMGSDFSPYVRMVVPPLLKAAADSKGAFMQDGEDDFTNQEGYEAVDFSVRGAGNKRLVVNEAFLQEKAVACNMLYQYASELGEGFFPYVEATAKIMVPLMIYRYNEPVRVAAVESIPKLMNCLKERAEKAQQPLTAVSNLFSFAFQNYMRTMTLEADVGLLIGILESFSDAIDLLPGPMERKLIDEAHRRLSFVLSESNRRRNERALEYKNADDEIREEIDEENEQEDEMIGYVGSVIKSMVDLSKGDYLPLFHSSLHSILWQYLSPKSSEGQQAAALVCYDNIIEACEGSARKYAEKFLPVTLCYVGNENRHIRQAAGFGVGLCALSLGVEGFAKYTQGTLKTLLPVILSKDARSEDYEEATESIIVSVSKILKQQRQRNKQVVGEVLPMWLGALPSMEETEGPVTHRILLEFLEDPSCPIYGPKNKNMGKVLQVLGSIRNTEYADEETSAKIRALVQKISAGLGNAAMTNLVRNLSQEQRANLL